MAVMVDQHLDTREPGFQTSQPSQMPHIGHAHNLSDGYPSTACTRQDQVWRECSFADAMAGYTRDKFRL